jgi:hypothetical protein
MKKFIKNAKQLKQGETYLIHYSSNVRKLADFVNCNNGLNHFLDITGQFSFSDNYINSENVKLQHVKCY